jgi:hypothetical protein
MTILAGLLLKGAKKNVVPTTANSNYLNPGTNYKNLVGQQFTLI